MSDDWTPADEFQCSRCANTLVEIKRCDEAMPGPYGPLLPAVFVCAGGHHVPATSSPGYVAAFDRWRAENDTVGRPEDAETD